MKRNKTKKVLACVLSVLAVAGFTVPANVGTGGLFGGTEIVAKAGYYCPSCGTELWQDPYDPDVWNCSNCGVSWAVDELGGGGDPAPAPTLKEEFITLNVGESKQIGVNNGYIWKCRSADENVATVSGSGMITAVGKGIANIEVIVMDYDYAPSALLCTVEVVVPPTLKEASITLNVGESKQIGVNNGDIWGCLSHDESVATVNDEGMITAVGEGTTSIEVEVGNPSSYESTYLSCTVTVKEKEECETIDTNTEDCQNVFSGDNYFSRYTGTNVTIDVTVPSTNGFWVDYNPNFFDEMYNEGWGRINVSTGYTITKVELVRKSDDDYTGSPVLSSPTAQRSQNGETFTFTNVNSPSVNIYCENGSDFLEIKQVKVYYKKVNGSVSVETAPTAKTLSYTGKPLELVTAGTASQGSSMRYSLDNKSWSADIPTGTNAGNYTVYYKAVRDGASDSEVGKVSVNIAMATPTVTAPTAKTLTYDGSAQALVNAGTTTGGTLQYKLDDGSWSTSIPTAKDAGNYTVYYKVEGNSNYNSSSGGNIPVEIKKADYTATVALNDWTYKENPKDNTPVLSGLPQEVQNANPEITYEYAPKGTNNWSPDVPVEEGEYTIRATIAQTANYNSQTATANFEIKLKEGFVHIQPNNPPAKAGSLFAGYFTDETCTKSYTGTDVAYAKFVDADKYLNVAEPVFSVNGSKGTLQISTLTPDSNVKEIRFEIKIGNSVKKVKADKLVKAESGCKAVYTLNNITKKYFGQTVTITPYWTTLDGTLVKGTPTTYTITIPNNQ